MKNTTSPRWVTYAPPTQTPPLFEAIETDNLNLYEIANGVHQKFSREARNKKIDLILNTGLESIDGDRSEFDFTGNRLEVSTMISQMVKNALAQTLEGSIEIFIQNKTDHFVIEVNDTGIGIHPDQKITFVETEYRGKQCKITFVQDPTTSLASIAEQLDLCEAELKIQVIEGKGMKRRLTLPKTAAKISTEITADYAVAF